MVLPLALEALEAYDPDLTGGAVLLGVEGRVRDLARLVRPPAVVNGDQASPATCVERDMVARSAQLAGDA